MRLCDHAAAVPAVRRIPAACRSWHAQCKTVQQTVEISPVQFLDGCGRACCCAVTGALVGSRRKLWSLRSCSACGRCPVPGQGCCARRCNDCKSRNAWYDYEYMLLSRVAFGRFFYVFPRDGVDSAPELDSRPALLGGTSSMACSLLVFLV